jgi:signal transduction histidine kinase
MAWRPPRPTIQLRLTMLYGSLFLCSGACLLAVTYGLVAHATRNVGFQGQDFTIGVMAHESAGATDSGAVAATPRVTDVPAGLSEAQVRQLAALAVDQHNAELRLLLLQSVLALLAMAVVSLILGWIVAGRALRPLRMITRDVKQISTTNLHARLARSGPDDELKELGDTFDDLLDRIEAAFRSQRQFVANASHELRTPLARQRTGVQLALSDPDATMESWRAVHERVLVANEQQARLIEALLTLARSEAGLDKREPVDLVDVTDRVLLAHDAQARRQGVPLITRLDQARTTGDPLLVERLVANLIQNALRYNTVAEPHTGTSPPDGRDATSFVSVSTGMTAGHAALTVANTGPPVPEQEIDRLIEPFQRLGAHRTHRAGGAGLGLSIVRAIAAAHDATVSVRSRPGGGLVVTVSFAGLASPAPVTDPHEKK